jgi:hypothetical protein
VAPELPPKLQDSVEEFIGRTWILSPITQWLKETTERLFLVTGKPGSGKSMISAWLGGAGPAPSQPGDAGSLAQIRSLVCAVHFCQATTSNSPRAFAENVATQLAAKVDGFAGRVVSSVSDRAKVVNLTANVNVGHAERTNVTGISLRLDLGSLTDEPSFDRALRDPLKELYAGQNSRPDPIVIIVDALDESLTYSGTPTIPHLLRKLGDMPKPLRVIATTRRDSRILNLFPDVRRLDVVDDEPKDANAIRQYCVAHLGWLDQRRRQRLADLIANAADGQFLYAWLLLKQIGNGLTSVADPESIPLPEGLTGYYNEYLLREMAVNRARWFNSIRPILGLIAVSQGDGLTRDQIKRISNASIEAELEVIGQYLEGVEPDGPFRPFHRSIVDFLVDHRHVNAPESHAAIAAYYTSMRNGHSALKKWDLYGLKYTTTHLAASLEGDRASDTEQVSRLVGLVLDPAYQKEHRARANDLAGLQVDLQLALRAASECDADAIPLAIEASLAVLSFRRDELRPEQLFDLVEHGQIEEAARRVDLFELSPMWRAAVRLTLAWSALPATSPAAAGALRDAVTPESPDATLSLLAERVDAALGRQPMRPLTPLPPPPPEHIVRTAVDNLGGSGQSNPELLTNELLAARGLAPAELHGATQFLAAIDGPLLVSFAAANPAGGDRFLKEYLSIHTGYQYVHYRQASLWVLLGAVLQHPDQDWVRRILPELAVSALAGTSSEFQEALPTTVMALHALVGGQGRLNALLEHILSVLNNARALAAHSGRYADSWAFHKRRLAAIVQASALLPALSLVRADAIAAARTLPYGFAGFQSPACLNLAEAIRIAAPPTNEVIVETLNHALTAAHNIQDEAFCMRQTARVNAMREQWWTRHGFDVETSVKLLLTNPAAPEFTTMHIVRGTYQRSGGAALRQEAIDADTLDVIAELYHCDVDDLVRVNGRRWQPSEKLDTGQFVKIPDPGFPTQLTARFAAEVVAQSGWDRTEKVQCIQRLIPLASHNATVLDTVLARLLLVAAPQGAALDQIERVGGTFPAPPASVQTQLPS